MFSQRLRMRLLENGVRVVLKVTSVPFVLTQNQQRPKHDAMRVNVPPEILAERIFLKVC